MSEPCTKCGVGQFPDSDWDDAFRREHLDVRSPSQELFDHWSLKLTCPSSFASDDECATLLKYQKPELTDARKQKIYEQASLPNWVPEMLLNVVGLTARHRPVHEAMYWLLECVRPTVFKLKRSFSRARPWSCCGNELKVLLPRSHADHPGHPSYPSGHATVAYVFADLLTSEFPDKAEKLQAMAMDIALNREIAGVHFPSDSAAGREVARQIVGQMLDANSPYNANAKKVLELLRSR